MSNLDIRCAIPCVAQGMGHPYRPDPVSAGSSRIGANRPRYRLNRDWSLRYRARPGQLARDDRRDSCIIPTVKRIHIVGCARSGTTLALEALVHGFAIDGHATEERHFLTGLRLPDDAHAVFLSERSWTSASRPTS